MTRLILLIAVLTGVILIGPAPSTHAQQQPVVVWIHWEDRHNAEIIERELQKISSGDRVHIFFHGGGNATRSGLLNDDVRFLEESRLIHSYDKLVIFDFLGASDPVMIGSTPVLPRSSLLYRWAIPIPWAEKWAAGIAGRIGEKAETDVDVSGYSAGAAFARRTLAHGARYGGGLTLLDLPISLPWVGSREITQSERSAAGGRIDVVYSRPSDDEGLAARLLHGGRVRGATANYDLGLLPHSEVTKPGSPAAEVLGKARKGTLSSNVLPPRGEGEGAVGITRCPPHCPPFFFPPGGKDGGAAVYPNLSPLFAATFSVTPIEPGGIAFSSIEVTYLAESADDDAHSLGFAVKGARAENGAATIDLKEWAQSSSDAFFVWLSLPNETFWVNLNPTEPDRIIDDGLGQTDVGRILLEADLQLKKDIASLTHPESTAGKEFWDRLDECRGDGPPVEGGSEVALNHRTWIVPGQVTVASDEDQVYIVDARLDVKLESELARVLSVDDEVDTSEFQQCGEAALKDLALPELIDEVNEAPQYSSLRQLFHARVLAEWYKTRGQQGLFQDIIDRGDIEPFRSQERWSPRDVFDRYKESFETGEYDITVERETIEGDVVFTRTQQFFMGGVDLTTIPMDRISQDELLKEKPEVEEEVSDAVLSGVHDGKGAYWVGGALVVDTTSGESDSMGESKDTGDETLGSIWHMAVGVGAAAALWLGAYWLFARRPQDSVGPFVAPADSGVPETPTPDEASGELTDGEADLE